MTGHYTEHIFPLPGAKTNHPEQGLAYVALPENIQDRITFPVIIAIHGSNRGALDYRDNAFYRMQRDIALRHGYLFAAVSNGLDTWGLDDGLQNIIRLYDYVTEAYPVRKKAALWASSAGGTLACRMVKEHPEKVSFVLGTFPVYDLCAGFALDTCKKAWNTNDITEFSKRIAGKNPAGFPELLKNHPYYIAHGSADTAVPLEAHSLKMKSEVGNNIHLEVIEGGVHATANFAFYGHIVDLAFSDHIDRN